MSALPPRDSIWFPPDEVCPRGSAPIPEPCLSGAPRIVYPSPTRLGEHRVVVELRPVLGTDIPPWTPGIYSLPVRSRRHEGCGGIVYQFRAPDGPWTDLARAVGGHLQELALEGCGRHMIHVVPGEADVLGLPAGEALLEPPRPFFETGDVGPFRQ